MTLAKGAITQRQEQFKAFLDHCDVDNMTKVQFIRAFREATGVGLTDAAVVGGVIYAIAKSRGRG